MIIFQTEGSKSECREKGYNLNVILPNSSNKWQKAYKRKFDKLFKNYI